MVEHSEILLILAKAVQSCARTGVNSAEKEPKKTCFSSCIRSLVQVITVLQTEASLSRPECQTAFHSNTATKN